MIIVAMVLLARRHAHYFRRRGWHLDGARELTTEFERDRRAPRRSARRAGQAHAGHRQPVRDDDVGPPEAPAWSTRSRAATRSRRSTPSAKGHATELCRRPRGRATTSSWRSAATAPSTRSSTAWRHATRRSTCLPGGATNVYVRMLGIPNDVVDATEHLLALADSWAPRAIDLARVNERWFTFSAGAGSTRAWSSVSTATRALKARRRLVLRRGRHRRVPRALRDQPAAARASRLEGEHGRGRQRAWSRTAQPYTFFNAAR